MEINHTYFQSQAFELPNKLVTCYFSCRHHAGVHNVRLLSEELIPRELLRHPEYASFLQESRLPAVNTSFNQPTEGFDAIPIDFQDPANQPYVLRFYLRGFRTRYTNRGSVSSVVEDWLNQTLEIYTDISLKIPFRLRLEIRHEDSSLLFLTLSGPKTVDDGADEVFYDSHNLYHALPQIEKDLNEEFSEEFLSCEVLNKLVPLISTKSVFPKREKPVLLTVNFQGIFDLINTPVPSDEEVKRILEQRKLELELQKYKVKHVVHYVLEGEDNIFFTQGLRLYGLVIHQAMGLLIEHGHDLLTEYQNNEEERWIIIEQLYEELRLLTQQVRNQLATLDPKDEFWHELLAQQNSSFMEHFDQLVYVVMLRYALIELERCWKELERHPVFSPAMRIGDFFERQIARMGDSKVLFLRELEEEKKTADKKSKPACFFKYVGRLDAVIADIFPLLQEKGLIAKETKKQDLKQIFSGKESSVVIQWTGKLHILTHLFKELCKGEKPLVTTYPNSKSKWKIVKRNFVDKEGNQLPKDIRCESARKKERPQALIEKIVMAFKDNLPPEQKKARCG